MDQSTPLNDEHAAALARVIDRCSDVMRVLTKAHDCGIDVDEPLAVVKSQIDKAAKYKANFFPHMP